jgi:hypothetical protein
MRVRKRVDLEVLKDELRAAGVPFRLLVIRPTENDDEWDVTDESDRDGSPVELPESARAIINAHTAPLDNDPDYGDEGDNRNLEKQVVQIVQQLRGYLALGQNGNRQPTNAETIGVIKILIRVVLVIIRVLIMPKKLPAPVISNIPTPVTVVPPEPYVPPVVEVAPLEPVPPPSWLDTLPPPPPPPPEIEV